MTVSQTTKKSEPPRFVLSDQHDRAAVVILDVEGQFGCQMKALHAWISKISTKPNLNHGSTVEIFSIPFGAKLSLDELKMEDLQYFMSKLTVKSTEQFLVALDNVKKRNPKNFDELFRELNYEIEQNQVIHISNKKSIGAALLSLQRVVRRLFDGASTTSIEAKNLMTPGKVSVVDVAALDDEEKRFVAIYLLAILDRQKRESSNQTRTVIVFDEAHKLFPQVPPKPQKDYIERVNAFVSDVVHRGRKRKYSVVVSTQSPHDVSKEISRLCDTDVIFEISGQGGWIRELTSSKEARDKIGSLSGVGLAHILCKGTPMVDTVPKIRFPNIAKLHEAIKPAEFMVSANGNPSNAGKIGWIKQGEKKPLEISVAGSFVQGFIMGKNARYVHPPQLLVAKPDDNCDKRIYCKVIRLESKPLSMRAEEKQISEFVTYVDLEPVKEVDSAEGYNGVVRNQNLGGFGLYLADAEDVQECFNLPLSGFPLGEMLLSEAHDQTILYHYPYNPNNYQRKEAEWLIDHSMFIVGNQGRGKTNALFYVSLLLACNHPEIIGTEIIKHCHLAA